MFEFQAYDRRLHGRRAPAPGRSLRPTAAADIAAMSFLFWSEHCVECAAPDCYASCTLHEPRADGRCRRFAYGIYRDRRYPSARGYGADITFRRWGKLKANGNTTMEPLSAILRRERQLGWASPVLGALGRTALRFGKTTPWADPTRFLDKRARRLHRRAPAASPDGADARPRPDGFLLEVWNPAEQPVAVELEMRPALDLLDAAGRAAAPPPFRTSVRLDPGHARHVVPHHAFASVSDCALPFKMSLTPVGDGLPRLVFLALDFVAWRKAPAANSAPSAAAGGGEIKCVVFDLDGTLWQGALVEGGGESLAPGAEAVLRELDRRGILLAVASKNDAGPALERLRRFGLVDLFVATRIGWGAKSRAIAEIAVGLKLGLDAFAFVDDSAFERAEVAAALPAVACLDARMIPALLADPRFRGGRSAVAQNRRRLYREARLRDAERLAYAGDEDAFLRACRTRLEIAPYRATDFERVAELAQRTNQLNASGAKYDRAACAVLVADPAMRSFVLRCGDVHGEYGTVGFAAVRYRREARQIRIEEFMLSCRVQGRLLEQAFFDHLATMPAARGAASLWLEFRETPRNGPLTRVLRGLGFRAAAAGGQRLALPAPGLGTDLVRVVATIGENGGQDAEGSSAPTAGRTVA